MMLIDWHSLRLIGLSLQMPIDSNLLKPIRLSLQTLIGWSLQTQID